VCMVLGLATGGMPIGSIGLAIGGMPMCFVGLAIGGMPTSVGQFGYKCDTCELVAWLQLGNISVESCLLVVWV
jgi:hypothetical protein